MKTLFTLTGTVKPSIGRGKKLGYPTANIPPDDSIENGLYIGFASFDNKNLQSLIFIGPSITFNETERKAEIYILDFKGDLYGKEIHVDVLDKLRNNIKFESSDALVAQMKQDEEDARSFFKNL